MQSNTPRWSRRDVLKLGLKAATYAGLSSSIPFLPHVMAAPPDPMNSNDENFKALVCVFLYGGNDSFNMLIPRSQNEYQRYAKVRRNLAIPKSQLLPLNGEDKRGIKYGLHPGIPELQKLYNNGQLAFVSNIGPLLEPTTRQSILNGSANLPPHLFSHSDQQSHWMTTDSENTTTIGWAGRVADLYRRINVNKIMPLNFSLGATNIWQAGINTQPLVLEPGAALELHQFWGEDHYPLIYRSMAELLKQSRASTHALVREYERVFSRGVTLTTTIQSILQQAPTLNTQFPDNNPLAKKLKAVARLMSVHKRMGMVRQLYFVGMQGWDTHDLQNEQHPQLLSTLSSSLGAFQSALDELQLSHSVTTYTASEFGRTLTSNGDGTDHGWGGNQIVMGGGVKGGEIYGQYPTLDVNGINDFDEGRIIPTLAVEQMASTLALWLGAPKSELGQLFPNLHRFPDNDLGFMVM